MWEEAVLTATYLINRIPTANQDVKCFGRRSDFSRLQIFGSKFFANKNNKKTTKITKIKREEYEKEKRNENNKS